MKAFFNVVSVFCLSGAIFLSCTSSSTTNSCKTDVYSKYHPVTDSVLKRLSTDEAFKMLKEGNERFVSNSLMPHDRMKEVASVKNGQWPYAAVVTCIDSRVVPELLFDQMLGDLFVARVAGSVIDPMVLGSLEYACGVVGSKLIVLLGHSACGGVKAACDHVEAGNIANISHEIDSATDLASSVPGEHNSHNHEYVDKACKIYEHLSVEKIKKGSSMLASLIDSGKVRVLVAFYDLETGKVEFEVDDSFLK